MLSHAATGTIDMWYDRNFWVKTCLDNRDTVFQAGGWEPEEPSLVARASFHEAFGISPDQQKALEENYRRCRGVYPSKILDGEVRALRATSEKINVNNPTA